MVRMAREEKIHLSKVEVCVGYMRGIQAAFVDIITPAFLVNASAARPAYPCWCRKNRVVRAELRGDPRVDNKCGGATEGEVVAETGEGVKYQMEVEERKQDYEIWRGLLSSFDGPTRSDASVASMRTTCIMSSRAPSLTPSTSYYLV